MHPIFTTLTLDLTLNSEIDVNAKNFRQESALILATKNSHESTLKMLFSLNNINPFITDAKGNTVLHQMAQHGGSNIVDLILKNYVSFIYH